MASGKVASVDQQQSKEIGRTQRKGTERRADVTMTGSDEQGKEAGGVTSVPGKEKGGSSKESFLPVSD